MPPNLVPTLTASPNTGELPSALVPCARQDGETLISSKTLIHNSRTMVTSNRDWDDDFYHSFGEEDVDSGKCDSTLFGGGGATYAMSEQTITNFAELCPEITFLFLRLNWCDSGWWRYRLNSNWCCQQGNPRQCNGGLTNASGTKSGTWRPYLRLMQVTPPVGQK